jgi:protein-glutamine gamma-glutamyltransferase
VPLAVITPAEAPRATSVERFFQWALYLLLLTGFVALMGTGKMDLPSLALVIPALLLRAYFLLMRKSVVLSERWTSILTVFYFVFFALDYFYISRSFLNATVHMVLFSLVIKIFSVRRDRDLLYLIVLSFLMVLSAAVLTVDTMFLVTFALFILAVMAAFIGLEMRRSERQAAAAGALPSEGRGFYRPLAGAAAAMGVLTMAGTALIFFMLPRLSNTGYLRNIGVQSAMLTGFSREVRLGGIGQIQQSQAVVMHIEVLSGKLPADPKWRGIALANFDGQRWWNALEVPVLRGVNNSPLDLNQASPGAFYSGGAPPAVPTLRYRVIMEPGVLNMFFLAPVPLKLNGDYRAVWVNRDGSVVNVRGDDADPGPSVSVYSAEADARDPEPLVLHSNARDYPPRIAMYLQLPRVDSRVRDLARRITASSTSNYARARAVESYLKSNYGYTLQLPGVKTPDQLAYFLFERKQGHCEYFASSMAIMLRTLNIPARVVNGFRGGEYNDVTGNYIVRESDAHSWVEVYFPEFGWVTFDPTPPSPAAVPGRWSRMALYVDAMEGLWREWIVNYDFSHQVRLSNQISTTSFSVQSRFRASLQRRYQKLLDRAAGWQRSMERMSPAQMALACVALGLLLALPFAPRTWRRFQRARLRRDPQRAPTSAASFWYVRMLKRLARSGIRKNIAQTPAEFTSSIADPEIRRDVSVFTDHYERARFAGSVADAERLPELYEEMAGKK